MKIRELRLRHVRNVGETLRTISFADEATGLVRPLTVLVGSNGSGKSSVFEVIEGLLSFALVKNTPVTQELRAGGYAAMRVELSETAPPDLSQGLWIELGRKHPAAFGKQSPRAVLEAWAEARGAPRPLPDVFDEHLTRLRAATRAVWHGEVTGRAVLKVFLDSLMRAINMPTTQHELFCALYMQQQPDPHQDLTSIVTAMLGAAESAR